MSMREDFEAWARLRDFSLSMREDGYYSNDMTGWAWSAWKAAKEESEELKTARRNLYDAIHAMTDSLDYEWDGDWRPEIEKLNGAHMRFQVKYRRTIK